MSTIKTAADYPFPVWGTQGGGLVRQVGEHYIFVEAPADQTGLSVGDTLPHGWDIIPANDHARREDRECACGG